MDFNFIRGATSKELEQFKAVLTSFLAGLILCEHCFGRAKEG